MKRFSAAVVVAGFVSLLVGAEAPTLETALCDVVADHERFTPEQIQKLQQVIREELKAVGTVDAGKARKLPGDFGVQLAFIFNSNTARATPAVFGKLLPNFRREVHNALAVPPLTAEEQRGDQALLNNSDAAIGDIVEKSYLDTPAAVREDLVAAIRAGLQDESRQVGNYFEFLYLYPKLPVRSREEIAKDLMALPAMEASKTRYARIEEMLRRITDKDAVAGVNRSYVGTERSRVLNAFRKVWMGYFKNPPYEVYENPTEEMLKDVDEANEALNAAEPGR